MRSEIVCSYRVATKLDDGRLVEATYLSYCTHHTRLLLVVCISVVIVGGVRVFVVVDHN